jgi:uncharacterized protein YfaT (DUF1175 family)
VTPSRPARITAGRQTSCRTLRPIGQMGPKLGPTSCLANHDMGRGVRAACKRTLRVHPADWSADLGINGVSSQSAAAGRTQTTTNRREQPTDVDASAMHRTRADRAKRLVQHSSST